MFQMAYVLSRLIESCRDLAQANGEDDVLQVHLPRLLASEQDRRVNFHIDATLNSDFERNIFNATVSHPRFTISFDPELPTTHIPALLREAIPRLAAPRVISFFAVSFPPDEVQDVLEAIESCSVPSSLIIGMKRDEQVMSAFARRFCAMETLDTLMLVGIVNEVGDECSLSSFQSLCNAVGQAPCLRLLRIYRPLVSRDDLEAATYYLAMAISDSTSLETLVIRDPNVLGFFSMDDICAKIAQTESFHSMELCYNRPNPHSLSFHRQSTPWKSALSQDIPLNYWSRVLEKANNWNLYDSHGPLDTLLFLIREKNDLLLQNVKLAPLRRTNNGRKRKRNEVEA